MLLGATGGGQPEGGLPPATRARPADKTLSPTPIPASDWTNFNWTPSSYQTVVSAGAYTYSIACGDSTAYQYSNDSTKPKYYTQLLGEIAGNSVASDFGGSAQAFATDLFQPVYPPFPSTDPRLGNTRTQADGMATGAESLLRRSPEPMVRYSNSGATPR